MSVATSFASAAPKAAFSPSWKETITGLRYTVVARGFYDLCLEPRAVQEAGAAGFDVSITLLRVATDNGGGRKEVNFPKEFRRVGASVKGKAPAVVVLREIKLKEGLSKQEAELEVLKLTEKLKQGDGYADSLVEEMEYAEKIERTKPTYMDVHV
jgi:hypothetical protein